MVSCRQKINRRIRLNKSSKETEQKNRRKQLKKQKVEDQKEKQKILIEKIRKTIRYVFAFDMSKNSPSMTIFDQTQNTFEIIAFLQQVQQDKNMKEIDLKDHSFEHNNTRYHVKLTLIPFKEEKQIWIKNDLKNMEIYDLLTDRLLKYVKDKKENSIALIEQYAFNIQQSSSITGLAELGGVLRHKLFKAGINFEEIASTSIKSAFAKKGSATKWDMWNRFFQMTNIDLKKIIKGSWEKIVPHPAEDMIDSFALSIFPLLKFDS